ncbi:MAG: NADP-dependent glyceraldehyde-3-phosphate dehydrogenase [Candidatus Cloacimonetes bacterium]|nr:NADP-dependent glyceraldehyde-3-phosphate dehydrogenase [Candidatus Cloacimonadota bacterium]
MKSEMLDIFPKLSEIPDSYQIKGKIHQKKYMIDGEMKTWNGPMEEVFSPICLKTSEGLEQPVIGSYPLLTEGEALRALDSAKKAYNNGKGVWPTMSVTKRIEHVINFINKMVSTREEVVKLLMWEIGKSLKDSQKEFDRTIEYMKDTIDALKDTDRASAKFEIREDVIGQIRRAPLGIVLCMGPYNYPLNETFATLLPALIMGNTVIFKPPKHGVLLHSPILDAFQTSFPKGVVNTVYGDGKQIITPLMKSGLIDVLAFIGTSHVADILKGLHPKPHRLKCVLGLEAKNAGIILPDADISQTVKECIMGTLSFNGQRCTALKIIFVHQDIAETFINALITALEELKLGMPWSENVQLTPLPEANKTNFLSDLIKNAVENGAKVVNKDGGEANETFFYPAILYPVTSKMKIYEVEQFGPLIPIVPFTDINTALEYIENSNYGQQVSIFGKDPKILSDLIDPLVNQVCRVNINCQCQRGPDTFPFTGRKDSAEGTLSVSDALRVFSIRTLVAAKDSDLNKQLFSTITQERMSNFLSTDFIF